MNEKLIHFSKNIMGKLILKEEEKALFKQALHKAYSAGNQNSTLLFNRMYQFMTEESVVLAKIIKTFCEEKRKTSNPKSKVTHKAN